MNNKNTKLKRVHAVMPYPIKSKEGYHAQQR